MTAAVPLVKEVLARGREGRVASRRGPCVEPALSPYPNPTVSAWLRSPPWTLGPKATSSYGSSCLRDLLRPPSHRSKVRSIPRGPQQPGRAALREDGARTHQGCLNPAWPLWTKLQVGPHQQVSNSD